MIDPIFEIVGLLAAFLTTSAFIPQVYKIYKEKNAAGISLTMYIILFTGVILWLIYGILISSLSIIIANGVTALLQLSIIIFKLKN
ncbi:MAG: SemiSWEET transporter [Cryomorphaceae bacterium]|jgi:MtN3 and saliva related transmembrane protein|nr:SemiSWEET transporter [Cryomorphaceae bacterium]MDG1888953.1 SemiSWEET transporter [Flavobacteriaceae bacterium]MBT3504149.1 SemiSWEET transporter [Cryomorphaceae bacterium]MBT3689011.1 SemiSWEET transporter [Cryomorphaceae bacterium]MBT4222336.1 SemiSWEET transporter [Cryomorphaceae bacterium]|tara:strand:+ start:108 stop:365 length:258 start_codon:yes stop_codon:yes gene_type:complete